MTDPSPRPAEPHQPPAKRAPGWIAPVLLASIAGAATCGIGVTVFHGALVDRGLPEAVSAASTDQQAQWQYGAQLADLGSQATALAELAENAKVAAALADLGASLSQGAALAGELRFDDQPPAAQPGSYSPEKLEALASSVAALSSSIPDFSEPDLQRGETFARIAFQINFDARDALKLVDKELAAKLPQAITDADSPEAAQTVACLADHSLIEGSSSPADQDLVEPVVLARALDRGYALDYTLQLKAARGSSTAAQAAERERTALNAQLRTLRSALPADCTDLRLPAYELPKSGLNRLKEVAASAQSDYSDALLTAAGNIAGDQQSTVAGVANDALSTQQSKAGAERILRSGAK